LQSFLRESLKQRSGSQSDKNGADSSPEQEQFSRSKMGYQAAAGLFILVLARTTATGFAQASVPDCRFQLFRSSSSTTPNNAVQRGITPASEAFELPFEFRKKLGPVDVNWEVGHRFVHKGPNGWLGGLVIGHDFTRKLEGEMELYSLGVFTLRRTSRRSALAPVTEFIVRLYGGAQPRSGPQQSVLFCRVFRGSILAAAEVLQD
jgi:hypothetical protein